MALPRPRVGIVGFGGIGQIHARALGELATDAELVAYSGASDGAAAHEGWPDAQRVSAAEVIERPDVDVVVICAPSQFHGSLALAALQAGKHVVIEKPMALSVTEAEEIARTARGRGLTVSVICQRRFEHAHLHLKRLLDEGALGDVRLASTTVHWYRDDEYYASAPWRTSMAGGGGSLMNQGVHNIDLLRWLAGPVTAVTAQVGRLGHDLDAEDTTVATLRFASGALGTVSISTATYPGFGATIALHCARGAVEVGQGRVIRWDVDGVPAPADGSAGIASGASHPLAIGHGGHLAQWGDILAALRSGGEPLITVEDGVETVRLLCAIYQAAESGQEVRLT